MEIAEFVKEFSRMCDEYNTCRGCPMDGICVPCTEAVYKDPQGVVEIVEKWSKEHTIKTRADKFKEVFGITLPNDEEVIALSRSWWERPYKAPKEG